MSNINQDKNCQIIPRYINPYEPPRNVNEFISKDCERKTKRKKL